MSPIRILVVMLAGIFLAPGCGRGTDSGKAFVPGKGHPEDWASYRAVGTTDFHGTFITSVSSGTTGATLFVLHCAPCHGNDGTGKIGPNIQSGPLTGTLTLINYAIQTFPVMAGHAGLSQSERQNIADYISTLAGNPQPVTGAVDTTLCMQCHGQNLDGGIARVSCYSCHNGPDGGLGHSSGWLSANGSQLLFHGPYGRDFSSGCTTCHGVDLNGGFVYLAANSAAPACSSCHNGSVAPLL